MSIKSQIGSRLLKFYESLGISKAEFARRLGKYPQNLNAYFNGDADVISLADDLTNMGCDINWLLTGKNDNGEVAESTKLKYKVIGTAAAGRGDITIYEDNQYYETADLSYNPEEHFFVKVDSKNGTSMYPVLKEGDLLLFSMKRTPKIGDIVLAISQKTQAGVIKILSQVEGHNEFLALKSYNQAHDVIMVNKDKVRIYPAVAIKYI